MKYTAFFLLIISAGLCAAADFVTGMAARMVIGQRTFTDQRPGASAELLGGVSGLAYANETLFVADANRVGAAPQNHRVLIYKNVSSTLPQMKDELIFSKDCPVCTGRADVVLGQPDFEKTEFALTRTGMRLPTAVASDGRYLVIADTENNRVLIWNSIPNANNTPADVVVGQTEFTRATIPPANTPNSRSMRGPQGVWIQGGKLYVADTQNHRILIFNSIPTANGAAADIVLGQPDFSTAIEPDLTKAQLVAEANTLLNPVSVTSDGTRLYVTDLGHNRVLIWNSLPSRNQQPADVVIGQPDMNGAFANHTTKLCASTGKAEDGTDLYPSRCLATLDFPRYALSDGHRVFIADGGNDRVLIFNRIPTGNGQAADHVIGQLGGGINQATDAADSMRTPMSLAWDGINLYVSDSFNRRVLVYSPAENLVPYTGVRNAASREIFAVGAIAFAGNVKENDEVTITIELEETDSRPAVKNEYKYKIIKDDDFTKVLDALATRINSSNDGRGDPNVTATPNYIVQGLVLTARISGIVGDEISMTVGVSTGAEIQLTPSGATLRGGQDAAKIAPGTIVSVIGTNLSEKTESAPADAIELPNTLADTQVYFDGIRAPLLFVSPEQINAQIPFEVRDRTSVNAWVRSKRADGSVLVTTPVGVSIVLQNPGIFAEAGPDPRPAVVFHGSAFASGTVSVDGSAKAGDVATIIIGAADAEDRQEYSYTVKEGDTKEHIRDGLIDAINGDEFARVVAFKAGSFTRIRLRSKVEGEAGNGLPFGAKANEGAQVIMSPLNVALCCANRGRVTEENPALPGETIIIYATGLGLTNPVEGEVTGIRYYGPETDPVEFLSSIAAGKTGNVLLATLAQGLVGVYEIHIELNTDIPTDPLSQLTIAQIFYVSNIVTFPVLNPKPPE